MAKIIRKVGLEGVRFIAPIGFFKEEQVLKNEFLVNISVSFQANRYQTDDLANTVDYSELFNICEISFKKECKLLETTAHEILDQIIEKYSFVDEIQLRINKLNPPIEAEIRNSFIELNYSK